MWNVTLPNRSSSKSPRCQGFLLTSRLFSPVSIFLYYSFFLPSSFPLGICTRLMIQFNGISLKELTFVYILLVEDGRYNGNKKPMAPPRSKVQGGPVVSVSPPTLQSG